MEKACADCYEAPDIAVLAVDLETGGAVVRGVRDGGIHEQLMTSDPDQLEARLVQKVAKLASPVPSPTALEVVGVVDPNQISHGSVNPDPQGQQPRAPFARQAVALVVPPVEHVRHVECHLVATRERLSEAEIKECVRARRQ